MMYAEVIVIAKVEWGNTSLGNPEPGMMYAEVIVPGFKIVLEADGVFYMYHTSHDEAVFVGTRNVPVLDDESEGGVSAATPLAEDDMEDPERPGSPSRLTAQCRRWIPSWPPAPRWSPPQRWSRRASSS